jgi:hypothetical protein
VCQCEAERPQLPGLTEAEAHQPASAIDPVEATAGVAARTVVAVVAATVVAVAATVVLVVALAPEAAPEFAAEPLRPVEPADADVVVVAAATVVVVVEKRGREGSSQSIPSLFASRRWGSGAKAVKLTFGSRSGQSRSGGGGGIQKSG